MPPKLFKSEDALPVPLPNDVVEFLDLTVGEEVSIALNRATSEVIIRQMSSSLAAGSDDAFAQQVSDFIEEYRPALEALARK